MSLVEPPSCQKTIVLIGRNSCGQWVAREQGGLFGGLFVSRAAAVRYALFENGHHLEAILPSTSLLELDVGRPSAGAVERGADEALPRRVA